MYEIFRLSTIENQRLLLKNMLGGQNACSSVVSCLDLPAEPGPMADNYLLIDKKYTEIQHGHNIEPL